MTAALGVPALAQAGLEPTGSVPEYPAAPATAISVGYDWAVGAADTTVYGSGCGDSVGQIRTRIGQEQSAGATTVTYGVVSVDSGVCSGDTFARVTVDLPPSVSFAISPASPVQCFTSAHLTTWAPLDPRTATTIPCPQGVAADPAYPGGFVLVPSSSCDPTGDGCYWPVPRGTQLEIRFPLTAPLGVGTGAPYHAWVSMYPTPDARLGSLINTMIPEGPFYIAQPYAGGTNATHATDHSVDLLAQFATLHRGGTMAVDYRISSPVPLYKTAFEPSPVDAHWTGLTLRTTLSSLVPARQYLWRARFISGADTFAGPWQTFTTHARKSARILGEIERTSPYVVYVGAHGELASIMQGRIDDLPTAASAPAGGAVFVGPGGEPDVAYTSADGRLHLYRSGIGDELLPVTDAVGTTASAVVFNGAVHVFYRSSNDNRIHDAVWSGPGNVQVSDINSPPAPIGGSQPVAYAGPDGAPRVLFVNGGHVIQLSLACSSCGWTETDLSAASAAFPSNGLPAYGYFTPWDNAERIVYMGTDAHVHEIWRAPGSTWKSSDLTPTATVAVTGCGSCLLSTMPPGPAVTAYATMGAHQLCDSLGCLKLTDPLAHVFFRDPNNHLNELWLKPGQGWMRNDLTQITGAPLAADAPATTYDPATNTTQVVYDDLTGNVERLLLSNGSWSVLNLTP